MTLYDDLGVRPSATPAEIKAARRRAAMRHHPDRGGGDRSRFDAAERAYRVLSDPVRRLTYDQTGSAEEKPVEGEEYLAAVQLITEMLSAAVEQGMANQTTFKPAEFLRRMISDTLSEHEGERDRLTDKVKHFERLAETFRKRKKGKPEFLIRSMKDRALVCAAERAAVEKKIKAIETALTIVGEERWQPEPPPEMNIGGIRIRTANANSHGG